MVNSLHRCNFGFIQHVHTVNHQLARCAKFRLSKLFALSLESDCSVLYYTKTSFSSNINFFSSITQMLFKAKLEINCSILTNDKKELTFKN